MSFILDALRKSEHERQRSSVPGLSHVPQAVPRREAPAWMLAVIAVLAVAVVALAGAWWRSARAPLAAAVPAMVQQPVAIPTPPPTGLDPASAARTPVPATAFAPPPAASTAPSAAQPTARLERSAPPPATSLSAAASVDIGGSADAPASPAPATAAATASTPTLPSLAALRAEGYALPDLRLELHAFSDRPAERFVFINGRKYVEGERLADGPELVSIAPNGAVLSQSGRRFLLVPE